MWLSYSQNLLQASKSKLDNYTKDRSKNFFTELQKCDDSLDVKNTVQYLLFWTQLNHPIKYDSLHQEILAQLPLYVSEQNLAKNELSLYFGVSLEVHSYVFFDNVVVESFAYIGFGFWQNGWKDIDETQVNALEQLHWRKVNMRQNWFIYGQLNVLIQKVHLYLVIYPIWAFYILSIRCQWRCYVF